MFSTTRNYFQLAKSLFVFFIVVFVCNVFAQNTSRWRPIAGGSEIVWDSVSARKIDNQTVRFWAEWLYLEEQRSEAVRARIYTQTEANSVTYQRVGIIAKCKLMEYAFFSITDLNSNKNPLRPTLQIGMNELTMNLVEPDTNMERLIISVCAHLKIK